MAALSREHPDGWGIAVFGDDTRWMLQKAPACAADDARFAEVAARSRGSLMIAHIRKRTVGPICSENTHPFLQGRWVFAHNGTIEDCSWLRAHTRAIDREALQGQTDSEQLFAYLLSALAEADDARTAGAAAEASDQAIARAVRELAANVPCAACTFLLSNGEVLYAHRSGRTLLVLERRPGDPVLQRRTSAETGAIVETPWSAGRSSILLASERITDEPWEPVAEGTLLRVDRRPMPSFRILDALAPAREAASAR